MSIPTVFDYADLLASIRKSAPEAHIAGGAVRDTILEKPIHDIDVFLADENLETVAARLRSSHAFVKVGEWKEYLGFSEPAMTRVAKFEKYDETIPVCLIGLVPDYVEPRENLSRFDFGICMAAFDGENITRSYEFDRDEKAQTFTLCRSDNHEQFAYSMARYRKITSGRYTGWGLVVPKEFKELAEVHTLRSEWWVDEKRGNALRPKDRIFKAALA